jgi:hypothetical protein
MTKTGDGVKRQRLHLGSAGMGVNRQLLHLADTGKGVNRKSIHASTEGEGQCSVSANAIKQYMGGLADRMRRVRVCSGDWSRVCGPSPTFVHGMTGMFFDPPYSLEAGRQNDLYREESGTVAHDVRRWCLANGDNPLLRIALCGYKGEGHEQLESHGWTVFGWTAVGGYSSRAREVNDNKRREVIWFNGSCLSGEPEAQLSFDVPPS